MKALDYWVDIKGFEGKNAVSFCGKIRSLDKVAMAGSRGMVLYKGKILKPRFDKDGYLRVGLNNNKKKIMKRVHRLVAEVFIPNLNNYPQVNHKNGIKSDNRIENLEWCSCLHNVRHALESGLCYSRVGENNNMSKLSKDQVVKIKKELLQHFRYDDIAKKYNVHKRTIWRIKTKRSWKYAEAEGVV